MLKTLNTPALALFSFICFMALAQQALMRPAPHYYDTKGLAMLIERETADDWLSELQRAQNRKAKQ